MSHRCDSFPTFITFRIEIGTARVVLAAIIFTGHSEHTYSMAGKQCNAAMCKVVTFVGNVVDGQSSDLRPEATLKVWRGSAELIPVNHWSLL
jgi:hypothetical protein